MEFVRRWFQGPAAGDEERCAEGADADADAWSERTAVITKYDHEINWEIARNFVEDIADKVVTDSCKNTAETVETGEDKKTVESAISARKQQLFLPDLVPSGAGAKSDAVSESDEYESADEQPLHDTVYLDTTVNPTVEASSESTPSDAAGWGNDLESSALFVPGVVHGTAAKDISVHVAEDIDCQPIVASTPAVEVKPFAPQADDAADAVDAVDAVDTVVRGGDCSVVAGSVNRLQDSGRCESQSDADCDLISQFEKLALSKQPSAEENETESPSLNQTREVEPFEESLEHSEVAGQPEEASARLESGALPLEETQFDSELANDAVPVLNATFPAGETESPSLNQTREVETFEEPQDRSQVAGQTEEAIARLETGALPLEETPFHSEIPVLNATFPAGETESPSLNQTREVETFEEPQGRLEAAGLTEEASTQLETGALPPEETPFDSELENDAVPVLSATFSAAETESAFLDQTREAETLREACFEAEVGGQAEAGGARFETGEESQVDSELADVAAVPAGGTESNSLNPTREEIFEEPATPEVSAVPCEQPKPDEPVTRSESAISATEVVAEEAATCDSGAAGESDQVSENTTAAPVSAESTELIEPEEQPEQQAEQSTSGSQDVEQVKVAEARDDALKPVEDEPIVPKKGYDLSFLDRLDNLENALPSGAKCPSPAATSFHTPSSPEAEPVAEAASCANSEPADSSSAILDSTFTAGEEKIATAQNVDLTPAATQEILTSGQQMEQETEQKTEQKEEEIVVPKKGYDLSWLDKLDDLENASPTSISTKSKVISPKKQLPEKKEAAKKEVDEAPQAAESPAEEQQAAAGKADSAPKKAPAARKPIRPRFQRPAPIGNKTDAFEIEFKLDPNDDPFKPKAKLGSSPPKSAPSEANITSDSKDDTLLNGGDSAASEATPEQRADMNSKRSPAFDETLVDDEEFRPAKEVFSDPSDLDFLMQHGGASREIALARQSLFVKFDPLVVGRPSMFPVRQPDGAAGGDEASVAAEEEPAGRASGGESLFLFSPPHPSGAGSKADKKDMAMGAQHPTAVDCLLTLENRTVPDDVIGLHEHREVLKLQELVLQDKLLQREREIQAKDNENEEIRAKLEATVEAQAQMRQIVGEYEKTISQLIADKEREKASMESSLQNTIKERDQAIDDLKEVERAFSEFHRMYERNRAAVENHNKNEEALKKTLTAYQERLQQEQQKYETLKLHAAQKLEGVQQEMENMKRALEAESSRVKAQLKKTEMRLASVETSLEQKSKENEELTKLCDELINKLGFSAK